MLEVEIERPQHFRHAHVGAAVGIVIRLERGLRAAIEHMVPARQNVSAGCVQALIEYSFKWGGNVPAPPGLAGLVGKQIALHHQGVAAGKIPV